MKISEIQLEMLLERFKRQASDTRRSEYSRQIANETAQALEELRAHRILGAIPVEGTVR
jgi:hypothetical protein